MSNIPISQFPAATEAQSSDVLAGVQSGATKKFSLAVILNWIKNTLTPANIGAIPTSALGAASGVAGLDSNGKVPTSQLPAFPPPSSATPQDLGTAAAGSSTDYSRADHVHQKPTYSASDVGLGNVDNVRQYSASNPPPYPVTSVNGNTGAVTVSVPAISTTAPSMDGTAAAGITGQVSDAGHVHPTDTSKADKTDIASIQATGATNTTGATIAEGRYFYLDGALVQARTNISAGATFTMGTNYDTVTAGILNEILTVVNGTGITTSVPNRISTNVMSVELTPGTWLVYGALGFSTANTGYGVCSFQTSDFSNAFPAATRGSAESATQFNPVSVITVPSTLTTATIYLAVYQASGAEMTVNSRALRAVKLR